MFSMFRKGQGSAPVANAASSGSSAAAQSPRESTMIKVSMTVNGKAAAADIDQGTLLVQFLRDDQWLTGDAWAATPASAAPA